MFVGGAKAKGHEVTELAWTSGNAADQKSMLIQYCHFNIAKAKNISIDSITFNMGYLNIDESPCYLGSFCIRPEYLNIPRLNMSKKFKYKYKPNRLFCIVGQYTSNIHKYTHGKYIYDKYIKGKLKAYSLIF